MADVKNAILTGASSGIGADLSKELVARGYRIGLVSRRAEVLEERVRELEEVGGAALALPADVTDASAMSEAVRRLTNEWGPVDLAIANAGIGIPTPAKRFETDDAVSIMRTNVEGTFTLFGATVPSMIERGEGHFVGVASVASFRGIPGGAVYSASKAAMRAFLEAVRVELRRTGVSVTTINPGFIETPMTEKNRFRMPFLMKPDKAARIIAEGIDRKVPELNFPLPMVLVMRLLRVMPIAVFDRLTGGFGKRKIDIEKAKR